MLLASLLVIAATLWASAFFIWPAAARARFVEVVSGIRDEADDALISGVLPDVPCVRYFIEKTEGMIDQSARISLSLLLAIHTVHDDYGVKTGSKSPTYGGLTPEQRKIMHELDRRLVTAIATYIVHGSRFAAFLMCAGFVAKRLPKQKRSKLVPPRKLAGEYNRLTTNRRPYQHA